MQGLRRCQVSGVSPATGLKSGQFDQKRNFKKRRSKYDKNRIGFSSLKENRTGSTGSSG
jgi:hypothetical protein